jgi:alpha-beta hydrolase superfamily lysophospholipase
MLPRLLRSAALAIALLLAAIFVVRAVEALTGPPLEPWHTFVPDEPDAEAIEAMDWEDWIVREDEIFASVRSEVVDVLDPAEQVPSNRYYAGSPINPARFAVDWNRSFVLEPEGPPRGAVVLLHGLTDSPYSLRHLARAYRDRGFVAIGLRLPGHGTVPGGLTGVSTEDWRAATRLATREAARRAGPEAPLHVVGYSNGGALATIYALEALASPTLPDPDQIVLLSPMIGITRFAAFSGLAGLPAFIPAFVRAAWLDTLPEFNPFKYNSFPVAGGRLSHRLTRELQAELDAAARSGALAGIAPVLAFQSVVDNTVTASALARILYDRLPENGSELVLFDLNRAAYFGPLIAPRTETAVERLVPPPPRRYAVTVVTNAGQADEAAVALDTPAGATEAERRQLGVRYPRDVFSLSHVALPFPYSDGVYGREPDPADDFGIRLGAVSGRGEFGVMVVGLDFFSRLMSNPFYPYLEARVIERMP